jgi:hypothetical protein
MCDIRGGLLNLRHVMTLTKDSELVTTIVTMLDAQALILMDRKDYTGAVDILNEAIRLDALRCKLYVHR